MTERAAHAARSVLSARSLAAATASAVRRRGLRWLAVAASAVARGPRCLAVAASAVARGLEPLAAADRVSGLATPAVAADCRLLVLDRSSVHVRPDAQRAADCHRADPAHRRRAAVPAAHFGLVE